MSKEWKCVECVKHGTDACYNGSKYEHDDCSYKLIDVDYAYEQGRKDAIEEFADKMIVMMSGHRQDILQIAEQLKENRNE